MFNTQILEEVLKGNKPSLFQESKPNNSTNESFLKELIQS